MIINGYKNELYSFEKLTSKQERYFKKTQGKFKYGYNEELDIVIISKDGTVDINNIYNIQGLKIGIPKPPKSIYSRSKKKEDQYWEAFPPVEELTKIENIFDWNNQTEAFKERHIEYISEEWKRRKDGFFFMMNGKPWYITGTHYMYLQWTKIDVGAPEYRESNRLFFLFWEACKADHRSFGMCYLKNRRSGFSFMASAETVNLATQTSKSRYGILSKTGLDAKKMFTDKVVPINSNYPFFFKPIMDGMTKPKTELAYRAPATKITSKEWVKSDKEKLEGLDTTIDYQSTGDNSYDGEKLKLLVHDESGKWTRPDNILNNWDVTKTCLRLGRKIVGKCMMGSTSNALDKGGDNFKVMYEGGDLRVVKRDGNGQTPSGMYSLFIPMEWNFEGFIDKYGMPVFYNPEHRVEDAEGDEIKQGVIDYWKNEVEGRENNPDSQNEYYRQFPRTEKHAFRDESTNSIFNLTKLYQQIDYIDDLDRDSRPVRGNFAWQNGVQDTKVEFIPQSNGRFHITWLPDPRLQNKTELVNGVIKPGNSHLGAFGCDSYDISATTTGRGSKGALHGLTTQHFSASLAPQNTFFLEYISRPPEAEIFFEDVLMACVFYGMPILIENNKPRLLYWFKTRGYRGYSMNRPDKTYQQLSKFEREVGGIPSSGGDMIRQHAMLLEAYINRYLGVNRETGEYPTNIKFERTVRDWVAFDITDRTKHDASISSGLAIMANQANLLKPYAPRTTKVIDLGIKKYKQQGMQSEIIN